MVVGLTTTTVSPNTVGYASYDVVDMAPGVPPSSYERPTLTGFSTLLTSKVTSLRSAGSDNDLLSRGWLVPPVMCVAFYHMTTTSSLLLGIFFYSGRYVLAVFGLTLHSYPGATLHYTAGYAVTAHWS